MNTMTPPPPPARPVSVPAPTPPVNKKAWQAFFVGFVVAIILAVGFVMWLRETAIDKFESVETSLDADSSTPVGLERAEQTARDAIANNPDMALLAKMACGMAESSDTPEDWGHTLRSINNVIEFSTSNDKFQIAALMLAREECPSEMDRLGLLHLPR